MKHIATRFLWFQERLANEDFRLEKIRTDLNPADAGTKNISEKVLMRHLQYLGLAVPGWS